MCANAAPWIGSHRPSPPRLPPTCMPAALCMEPSYRLQHAPLAGADHRAVGKAPCAGMTASATEAGGIACHRPPGLSAAHTPYPIGHWRTEGDTQLPTTGARPGTATGLLGGSNSARVCRSSCARALVCTVSPEQLCLTTAACTMLRARAKPKLLWIQPIPRLGEGKNHVIFRHIRHASHALLVRPP